MNKRVLMVLLLALSFAYGQVSVSGDITADETWTADNAYLLTGQVFVKDGVTLTIEAGTNIYGQYGEYDSLNVAPALVVERGGMLYAEGTAAEPITFATELLSSDPNYGDGRGLWGGLIVCGQAPIATTGGENFVEGLAGVLYGGNDPDDNSGVLRYVRVYNGGSVVGADNEINGITLAGVGNGTTVEYCEVGLNADDGFEMFGGTVDLKYCSVVQVKDDAFDTDEGYQGRGQFLFVQKAGDSDRAHEMDNKTNGNLDSSPRSHPKFANVTIIGGDADSDILKLREGTGGDFRNYIMVGGTGDGIENDDNGSELVTQDWAAAQTAGYPNYLYISSNTVMWDVADPFQDFTDEGETWTALFDSVNPGINYTMTDGWVSAVDPRPTPGGPAYDNVDAVDNDGFFTQVGYRGAFGTANWLAGWSWLDEQGILSNDPLIIPLAGDIEEDVTWTADNNYLLTGQVFVKDGVTLTIEAGTTIYGQYGEYDSLNVAPALVVERGGMLYAEGTAAEPITFKTELLDSDPNFGDGRGLWGGLIICGRAPIATTGGENFVEGLAGVLYGGTDAADNSGVLRYVRVYNGGSVVGADNEINGITLAGVGNGTTVEYCEVGLNADDGFEMFGGTVDLKYCSVVQVKDDAFDTDEGYQGRGQFLFVQKAGDSDRAHEMDNKTNGDLDSSPRSHPKFANVTIIGGDADSDILKLREGTGGDFRNYIMVGGTGDGIENDDNGSELVTQDWAAAQTAGYPNYLYISSNTVMWDVADPFQDFTDEGETWTALFDSVDVGITYTMTDGWVTSVDPRPTADGPAYQNVDEVADDDFFTQVNYRGAFGSGNWLMGWSWLDEQGILEDDIMVTTLSGDIEEDMTLTAADMYLLTGQTFVKDGVTLTIEAGTTIYGQYGEYDSLNVAPALVVERGGMLYAEGTADEPITFKSELLPNDPNYGDGRGLWGGLIICGRAPIATTGGENFVEGLAGVLYGGTDAADNSGVLRYVRVYNGGSVVGADNEINGITLAGVGNGTTVEYCEVALNADDGFEMFGGTVDLKYCSVVQVKDDAFDTDEGYQGRGQFLFVQKAGDSDRAHEMDNKTNGDLDSSPRSHPQFANVTIIGGDADSDILKLREGTGGDFRNYIMVGGAGDGIENDDNGSEVVTQDWAAAQAAGHPDFLYISPNTVMWDVADPFQDFTDDGETWTALFDSVDVGIDYIMTDGWVSFVDPRPIYGGPAYDDVDAVISDDFFTQVNYRGAFGTDQWLSGWSWLDEMGMLGGVDVAEEAIQPKSFELLAAYPNPFNPTTTLRFALNRTEMVEVTIMNILGQEITSFEMGTLNAGVHALTWDGTDRYGVRATSGLYLYKVQAGGEVLIGKVTMLK